MESHQLFFSVLSVFFSDKTFCDGKSLREKTGWNSFSPQGNYWSSRYCQANKIVDRKLESISKLADIKLRHFHSNYNWLNMSTLSAYFDSLLWYIIMTFYFTSKLNWFLWKIVKKIVLYFAQILYLNFKFGFAIFKKNCRTYKKLFWTI
jgi:hypothetical protein